MAVSSCCRLWIMAVALFAMNSTLDGNVQKKFRGSSESIRSIDEIESMLSPLRTVNDDINDGLVKISVCKNAIFSLCPTKIGQSVHFNETIHCLLYNLDQWDNEGTCATVLGVYISNIFEFCISELTNLCGVSNYLWTGGYEAPSPPLTCLAENYFLVGSNCQSQLDDLIGNMVPCAEEEKKFCPEVAPTDSMLCLNNTLSTNLTSFSPGCKTVLSSWSDQYTKDSSGSIEIDGDGTDEGAAAKEREKRKNDKIVIEIEVNNSPISAFKMGVAISMFIGFMLLYFIRKCTYTSDVRQDSRGDVDGVSGKGPRGAYIRTATAPEEWDEDGLLVEESTIES